MCGVGAKSVAHLMKYHLLQLQGATTKSQVKRYIKRDIREIYKIVSDIPVERLNSIRYLMQDQRSNQGHTMTLHTYNPTK